MCLIISYKYNIVLELAKFSKAFTVLIFRRSRITTKFCPAGPAEAHPGVGDSMGSNTLKRAAVKGYSRLAFVNRGIPSRVNGTGK